MDSDDESSVSVSNPSLNDDLQNRLNLQNELKKKRISSEQWKTEQEKEKAKRSQMDNLIANYLYINGENEPLKQFIKESKIDYKFDEKLLKQRYEIRKLIINNNIEEAINKINGINSTILEKKPELIYQLKRQKLVDFIKQNKVEDALNYAKNVLLPMANICKKFYDDLENLLSYLAFDDLNESPDKTIFDSAQLELLANKVNLVILDEQEGKKNHNLIMELLIKILLFNIDSLGKDVDLPKIMSFVPFIMKNVDIKQENTANTNNAGDNNNSANLSPGLV